MYHDGTPVTDDNNYVKIKQFYSYNEEEFTESKHKLSSLGTVELQYFPPMHNVSVLRIEVSIFFCFLRIHYVNIKMVK